MAPGGAAGAAAPPWPAQVPRTAPSGVAQSAGWNVRGIRTEPEVDRRLHPHLDGQGWLYQASVVDLFSRRVVGWQSRSSSSIRRAKGRFCADSVEKVPAGSVSQVALDSNGIRFPPAAPLESELARPVRHAGVGSNSFRRATSVAGRADFFNTIGLKRSQRGPKTTKAR